MILELYIWGPGFNLPSIDAYCLASIALLKATCTPEEWTVIPSSDPAANPFNQLPALRDGDLWLAGWHDISSYIRETRRIDSNLTDEDVASREAYSSFLESRGLPLLDLSLYVSSDNYTTCTRDALGKILHWPHSWSYPLKLRDQARKRSEHLGLSALDVDAIREKELKRQDEGISAQIPKSLRRTTQSVTSLLGSSAQQTRFRLEAVTADFFEPVEHLLKDQAYLLGDQLTTVDCLAVGILSLMQVSELPQRWLEEALIEKHPKLGKWAQQQKADLVGDLDSLPWQPAPVRTWLDLGSTIMNTLLVNIPLLKNEPVVKLDSRPETLQAKLKRKQSTLTHRQGRERMLQSVLSVCVTSAGFVGWLMYSGLISLPQKRTRPIPRRFGEAGSLLGLR